jgi:putative ABC transport system permease protein
MSVIDALRYRWRAVWKRGDLDRDVDEELRHYAELDQQQRVADVATTAKAGTPVVHGIGNVTFLREELRRMSTLRTVLDHATGDMRYAVRTLRKNPTFALVAAATLALGVGANATIFSIVDAVLLRPLHFPQPDQLVRLFATRDGLPVGSPSPLDVEDIARDARSFQHVVAYDEWRKNVRVAESEPEEMIVGLVSAEYFRTLGVTIVLGRTFADDERQFGRHFVCVIGHELWQQRYGGRPSVLGEIVRINEEPYTIVGVVSDPGLGWLNRRGLAARIWTPWARRQTSADNSSRGATGNDAIARLRPGVPLQQARAEVSELATRLAAEYPADRPYGMTVVPLVESRAGALMPLLEILGGAVILVLLISCSNFSSLLHARNSARERELLVRTALGATRARLARQLVVETVVLAAIGGACGFLLAIGACAAVARWHPAQFPQLAGLSVNSAVLGFAFAVSLGTGVAFGVWPAWLTSRVDIAASLRVGGRTGTASREQRRARSGLVVCQIALALMLATATAILAESVVHLRNQELGFDSANVLKAHLYIPPARYSDPAAVARFADEFGSAVRALPDVRAASVATGYLPAAAQWIQPVTINGQPPARSDDRQTAYFTNADDWYLRAYDISLVRGRDFASSDVAAGLAVALVSESFVKEFIAGRDAVGTRIELGSPIVPVVSPRPITIIGVFRDVKNDGLNRPPRPQVVGLYRQLPEFSSEFKDIVVRTAGDPALDARPIRMLLAKMDPDIALAEVATMSEVIAAAAGGTTYAVAMLGAFAILGLALAGIGTYGVVAFMVSQRTSEIGIRSALGATPLDIVRLVVGGGLGLGIAGSALGVVGSIACARLIAGQVYGVSATDPVTLAGAAIALLTLTAIASAIPALRALGIDSAGALRGD